MTVRNTLKLKRTFSMLTFMAALALPGVTQAGALTWGDSMSRFFGAATYGAGAGVGAWGTSTSGGAPSTYSDNIGPHTGGVIGVLETPDCAGTGWAAGCTGGYGTHEYQGTTSRYETSTPTISLQLPEPETLALVGLALLGLGLRRTRTN